MNASKPKRKPQRPTPAPADAIYLSDRQAAYELGIGLWKLHELQKNDPAFPAPFRIGPRCKRHRRDDLRAYVEGKRERLAA